MDGAKSVLLKLGVPLVVPLVAYLLFDLRFRNSTKPPNGSRCSLPATVDCDRGLKDTLRDHQNGVVLFNIIIHGFSTTPVTTSTVPTSTEIGITCERSPSSKTPAIAERLFPPETDQPSDPPCYPAITCSDDEQHGLRLHEVHQQSDQDPADSVALITEINNTESGGKEAEEEQEIAHFSNMFQSLWEMDTLIQIQILERQGRKEQDDAIRDLENRLHESAIEADRLRARIESLQNENQMLNLQASIFLINMENLETEKANAKRLQRKAKFMRVRTREKLGSFEQRIGVLRQKLQKMERDETEARSKLQRLRDVEVEVAELRTRNLTLLQENLNLSRRRESAQTAAVSCSLEISQVKVQEEANQTREANDRFDKKTELLNADFGDEELTNLRRHSAQLKYETKQHIPWKTSAWSLCRSTSLGSPSKELTNLRRHSAQLKYESKQHIPWKTPARSLCRSTSLGSPSKTAELVFEAANERDIACRHSPKGCDVVRDVTTIAKRTPKRDECPQKPEFSSKFKELLPRKSGENNEVSQVMVHEHLLGCGPPEERDSFSTCSIGDAPSRCSTDSTSSSDDKWQNTSSWIQASYKSPLDVTTARSQL